MLAFSSLLKAVPHRQQSAPYAVLAALYHLSAHTQPVTAKQLGDLLRLHMGNRAPSNIPKELRRLSPSAEPAAEGPPITWTLTAAGLESLRAQSGLSLTSTTTASDFDFDIAIICALEQPEFSAVTAALGGSSVWKEIGSRRFPHVYREARLKTAAGSDLRVVATTSTSMGLTAAAIATSHLVLQFRPRLVVMVGIAAGTRDGGKQFGDVLVADPSIDYNSGKIVLKDGKRGFQPDPYPIGLNPRLRSVLQKFKGQGTLFREIRSRWKGKAPDKPNRLHIGPVGAADQVIDDASRVVEIQGYWRKLLGVEMESYGVYRACDESPEPKPRMASFKAVCDFAAEKSDSWQEYAAFVAAEFTVGFLKSEWEVLWDKA